jgi:hypothetical protein
MELAGATTGNQRKSFRGDGHERIILRALALVPRETNLASEGVVAIAVESHLVQAHSRISLAGRCCAVLGDESAGTGFGDRFEAFRGGSRLFEEGVRRGQELAVLQGKCTSKRWSLAA